jgi:hypothetical protein
LTSVDVEMLCQQAINTLSDAAKRREQQIRLSLEHGRSRTWILDKDKVRHLLYQLLFSTIQTSPTASVIHLHVSHKSDKLNLTVSVSHPWLGAGLTSIDPCFELPGFDVSNRPQADPSDNLYSFTTDAQLDSEWSEISSLAGLVVEPLLGVSSLNPQSDKSELESPQLNDNDISSASNSQLYRSCETLRLLLSCHLAKLHGGQISVQGTAESGYRYVVTLPQLEAVKESSW